jgi:hypothetical protein
MKILREGKPKCVYFVGECSSCGCIIKVHIKELSDYRHGDYRSAYEDFGTFACPTLQCDKLITCHAIESKTGQRILKSV